MLIIIFVGKIILKGMDFYILLISIVLNLLLFLSQEYVYLSVHYKLMDNLIARLILKYKAVQDLILQIIYTTLLVSQDIASLTISQIFLKEFNKEYKQFVLYSLKVPMENT